MLQNGTETEEVSVLREFFTLDRIGPMQVVRAMTTVWFTPTTGEKAATQFLQTHLPGLESATLADHFLKNAISHPISLIFTRDDQLQSVDEKELGEVFRDDEGWERFDKVYPQSSGILEFSRVGFNHNLTQALFYARKSAHWLGGSASYYLFKCDCGHWAQVGSTMVCIS